MYDVLDICYYIIKYSNDKDYGVSNLKLQKLLYFIQVWFLINTHRPCFKEKIEAWSFGSVVPEAYKKFSQYACMNILLNHDDLELDPIISESDKYLINQVIDKFANYTATDLLNLILHQQPWLDAYYGDINTITNKMLLDYFAS